MKCKCGFEIQEVVAVKYGCLMCGDKSFVNEETQKRLASKFIHPRKRVCVKGFSIGGEHKPKADWCDQFGVNYKTVMSRVYKGMCFKESLDRSIERKKLQDN